MSTLLIFNAVTLPAVNPVPRITLASAVAVTPVMADFLLIAAAIAIPLADFKEVVAKVLEDASSLPIEASIPTPFNTRVLPFNVPVVEVLSVGATVTAVSRNKDVVCALFAA